VPRYDISEPEYGVEPGDAVCFSFGEIDCRCHIDFVVNESALPVDKVIRSIVTNYIQWINESKSLVEGIETWVQAVPPAVRKADVETRPEYAFVGTDASRKHYVKIFNSILREMCGENGIRFIPMSEYEDDEGYLSSFYSDGTVHIYFENHLERNVAKALKSMQDMETPVPSTPTPTPTPTTHSFGFGFGSQIRIIDKTTRLIVPGYDISKKPESSASLYQWMTDFLNEIKFFVGEIVCARGEVFYERSHVYRDNSNKPKTVVLFFGNINTLDPVNTENLANIISLVRANNGAVTSVFWGVLEGTRLRDSIVPEVINTTFDHFWVASEFVKQVVNDAGIGAVCVYNGVNHRVFNTETRFNIDSNIVKQVPSNCRFLCVATDVERKNIDALVYAFEEEFKNETVNEVSLLIKSTPRANRFNGTSKVFTLNHDIPTDSMGKLIKSCHYFVSTSRSEGFCLPAAEALACGKKLVMPYYSGVKTFASPKDVIPIKFEEVDVPPHIHDMWGKWATMKKEDVRAALREAYTKCVPLNTPDRTVCLKKTFSWHDVAKSVVGNKVLQDGSFLALYTEMYMPRLHAFSDHIYNRSGTFYKAFEYLENKIRLREAAGGTRRTHILETGCTREKRCFSDGNSTVMFDHFVNFYEGSVTSIDINPENCRLCSSITTDKVTVICGDSVKSIYDKIEDTEKDPIDLVYLDSFDLDISNPHDSAMHHVKELVALLPLLKGETLILIDDSITKQLSKGKYVREFFDNIGIEPFFDDYQLAYIWKSKLEYIPNH